MNRKAMMAGAALLVACSQAASDGEMIGRTSDSLGYAQFVQGAALSSDAWVGNQVELLSADAYYNCANVKEYYLNGGPPVQFK